MSFELIRMLCVNSYKPGKVVELRLADGHVLILGRNGAGKTTLAQLIPLFYGVPPSQLVDRSGGKSPLTEFLLRGRASYIVFEYRRYEEAVAEDALRLAVLRADTDGRMVYQLFRGGYDARLFITEDRTFRDFADVAPTARDLGIRPSAELGNADYTRVIQNLDSRTKRQRANSNLSADFACVEAGHDLRHLDKIVGSMFKESAGFDDFQRIVISALKLNTDRPTRELQLGKSDIYTWRDQRLAYIDVMRYAPQMATARAEAENLSELIDKTAEARAQAQRLRARSQRGANTAQTELDRAIQAHNAALEVLRSQKQTAEQNLSATKESLREANGDLAAIEKKRKKYETDGVDRYADKISNRLPQAKQQLESATSRHEELLGSSSTINASYETLISRRRARLVEEERGFNEKQETARQEAETEKSGLNSEEQLKLAGLRAALSAEIDPRRSQRDVRSEIWATQKALARNPVASKETIEHLAALGTRIAAEQSAWQTTSEQLPQLEGKERERRREYDAAEKTVKRLSGDETAAVASIAALEDQIRPSDDSLLAFLRGNVDGWEQTIGKVIDATVLQRDDLRPIVRTDDSTTMMGVELDLTPIEVSPALSVEAIKAKKAQQEADLEVLRQTLAQARSDQGAASESIRTAEKACSLTRSNAARHHSEAARLQQQQAGLETQKQIELEACREAANGEAEKAERALEDFDKETEEIEEKYDIQRSKIASDFATQRRDVDARREKRLQEIDLLIGVARNDADSDIEKYELDRNEKLVNSGVDPEKLEEISTQIAGLQDEIGQIERNRPLVVEWEAWKESVARRKPGIDAAVARLEPERIQRETALREISGKEQQANDAHSQRASELTTSIETYTAAVRSCDQLPVVLDQGIPGSLRQFPESTDEHILVTVATLEASGGRLVSDFREGEGRLRESISLVRSAMLNAHNSVIRDFYDKTEASKSNDPIVWTKSLGRWFDYDHQSMLQTLVGTGRNITGQIRTFYNDLTEFNREVGRFNNELQRGLQRSMLVDASGRDRFDKITGLDVIVSSRLTEEKMWGPLETFVAQMDSQEMRQRDNQVPTDEFVDALTRVLSTWGTEGVMQVDLSNQVRIRGEVTENGNRRRFASAVEFKNVSSSGLSCIVLMAVLCGFVHMVRGPSKTIVTWAIDETGRLDAPNIRAMLDVLTDNRIRLVTATPELPKRSMQQFDRIVQVTDDRDVLVARVPDAASLDAKFNELSAHV